MSNPPMSESVSTCAYVRTVHVYIAHTTLRMFQLSIFMMGISLLVHVHTHTCRLATFLHKKRCVLVT